MNPDAASAPDPQPDDWRLGRRELLSRLGRLGLGAAALSFLPGCPGGSYRSLPLKGDDIDEPKDDLSRPLRIGISKVPAGQAVDFSYGGVKGYLHQTGDGRWLALSRRCTHNGCLISFQRDIQGYKCPCHGSAFDQEGRPIHGPAKRPLDRYPVLVEGDAAIIDLRHKLIRQTSVTGAPAS
jgi:nitrite reductase/ring-hydroxylating ferredoxin subunit